MKHTIEKLDKALFYSGVTLCLAGIIHPILTAIGSVVLFLWLILFLIVQLPMVIRDSHNDSAYRKRQATDEAERKQWIRHTTKPETYSVSLDTRQDQGMSAAALILVEESSNNMLTLRHEDFLKIYNPDGTVLFEGMIDLSPSAPWYKKMNIRNSPEKTQKQYKNWQSWFHNKPALKAQLTRYKY